MTTVLPFYFQVKLTHVLNDVNKCKLLAEKVCHLNAIIKYLENVLDLMKESCETVVQVLSLILSICCCLLVMVKCILVNSDSASFC